MGQYMSVGDAAKALGVVPATVKLMVRRGTLAPSARTVGGIQLFAREDVERLAEKREAQSTALAPMPKAIESTQERSA